MIFNQRIIIFAVFYLSFFSLNAQDILRFTLPVTVSIRAIQVVNDSTVWFGGTRGIYGYTENNGRTWHIDSLHLDTLYPEFRSIAVIDVNTAYLLSIGSPALLYKTTDKGKNWRLVYKDIRKEIFFDGLVFSDAKNGWALADPLQGCFQLIHTNDGGETWTNVDCKSLPPALDGESFFASSNTCLEVKGPQISFVSGGKVARVIRSKDDGKSWDAFVTPLQQGKQTTGIYSHAFYDEMQAVVAGGNYDKKENADSTIAFSRDGGKSWSLKPVSTFPAFVSCIRYVPMGSGTKLMVASLPGIYFSNDKGLHWKKLADDAFYTLAITQDGRWAWFAGSKGRLAKVRLP